MESLYEHTRDCDKSPVCWRILNDRCMPHFHSSMEFVYITAGELKATLNGKPYTVKKGQILISPSYTLHYYSTEEYSESIVLIVPLDFITTYNKVFKQKEFSRFLCEGDADGEILHCMSRLAAEGREGVTEDDNIARGYITVILAMLIDRVGLVDIPAGQNRYLTRDILVYLQNNYLDDVSLGLLASHFGYSKSRFSHIFNDSFGCSINEYVNSLRCRHAANLLVQGSPMIDVAMSSGFECIRTFYRRFKQCYGMTPTQYCSGAEKDMEGFVLQN